MEPFLWVCLLSESILSTHLQTVFYYRKVIKAFSKSSNMEATKFTIAFTAQSSSRNIITDVCKQAGKIASQYQQFYDGCRRPVYYSGTPAAVVEIIEFYCFDIEKEAVEFAKAVDKLHGIVRVDAWTCKGEGRVYLSPLPLQELEDSLGPPYPSRPVTPGLEEDLFETHF